MRTSNRIFGSAWCLSVVFVLAGLRAQAADTVTPQSLPAVDQIGSDATSYVYRMGWDELKAKLAGTQALEVIEDPQVLTFLHGLRDRGQGRGEMGDIYSFVIQAWRQELVMFGGPAAGAAAAPSADKEKEEEASEGRPASRDVAFIKPSAAGQEAFHKRFDALLAAAKATGHEPKPADVAGTSLQVIDLFGEGTPPVHAGWQKDRLVWAVGKDSAAWGLKPAEGKKLAENELFQQAVAPLMKDQKNAPFALYYYDLRPTWKRFTASPEGAGWEQVSWRSLDAVAGASFIEGNGYRNRHYWKVGPQRSGLFKSSQESRINPDWLKRVPADASGFTAGVWDAWSFVVSMAALGVKLTGEGGDEQLAALPTALTAIQPMLAPLGSRYLVYRLPRKYSSFPVADLLPLADMVLVADVRDGPALEQTLDQITIPMVGGVHKVEMSGHQVRVVPLMYLQAYAAVIDKQVIVAFNSQMMRDALENWDKPGPAIVDTEDYKKASQYLLPDACFELYMPPGGFSRGWLDKYLPVFEQAQAMFTAINGMNGGDEEGEKGAPAPLIAPRGSDIAKHVTEATIISAHDDGQGVLFDGRAPVLCTPYYWSYFHSLSRFGPAHAGMLQWAEIALMGRVE